ncbi:hypothetical protein ACWATR_27570 [Nostoc sp. UIC 10890]
MGSDQGDRLCHNFVYDNQSTWKNFDSFGSEHESIRSEHESIRSEHESIRSEHEFIRSEHESIRSEHESIRSEHESIRSEHESIRSEHESIRSEHKSIFAYLVLDQNIVKTAIYRVSKTQNFCHWPLTQAYWIKAIFDNLPHSPLIICEHN